MTMGTAARHSRWYKSLYWRVAVSFVLLLTIVVGAQAAMFLWFLQRGQETQVTRRNLTLETATRLGTALAQHGGLDVSQFLRAADSSDHLIAIMRDGRVIGTRTPTRVIVDDVIRELNDPNRTAIPATWRMSGYGAAAITVDGHLVGVLGFVPPSTFEESGREIVALGLCVLIGGVVVTAVFVFGPTRRRLRDLEAAARRLESGDLEARAHETGGDEVTELARAFNSMAVAMARHASEQKASELARRQLLADVSHEAMTPLTAIRGYLETLAMTGINLDAVTRQKQVAFARRETQRLERLIGDLLDTARFESGGGHLEVGQIQVSDLCERVAEHHERECQQRGIRFQLRVSPETTIVVADPFRLEQALVNVTANACRHTPDGGEIDLRAGPGENDSIVFAVTDSGEGIPPEHLPLIFDRFHKAPSSRGELSRGSGLGLSIVKAIVERHGGHVAAVSTLGRGTTISLTLPAAVERDRDISLMTSDQDNVPAA